MINELLGIQYNIEKARLDGKVQNLAYYINESAIIASHKEMDRKKAKGIDGVSKDDYSVNLKANVERLLKQMRNGSYQPEPIRRTYIPKDGSKKMRPLGISCYEDKLVENVIAKILIEVYEPKFFNESYGFRPNRSCHQAIREIIEDVQYHKVSYIVEADIKGFFNNVDHEWLIKFLEHDIADKKFIEIIKKFLKAGIMENGKYLDSERGTPQGNGASPVLANIYLHYVLDYWFAVKIKRKCKGEAYLIRYCDDFVCCFQNKWEADGFYQKLIERFDKFGLEFALEKTKILEFGRFAKKNRANRGLRKPETFDFLGFTFYCSEDGKKGFFRCKVKTSKKKFRSKVKTMKEWIKKNRIMPVGELIKKINQKLRGHYQYYGVTDNTRSVKCYQNVVKWLLFKWLNRRSQRKSYTIETFYNGLLRTFPLLEPKISVSLFYR
ncbi:group II intron reverse transcriptase/maturase [Clostridium sp. AWRP]|uniref:group II intron reverse transcriptase/maturase n=1 Tax=Clostridium sp. AWRP TaxID=2212991 RepID=UPI000FDBFD25|nr:group II intron reverse transcriptase/maturase [Clostridium sp. AWRP]AZV56688.1 group II intron reverse transcriptase/maturase [Clostridium sp. AWRP]AZV58367.1 group II intron reverse transcriptase/maturase [Clostridium sp. AWRP]